MIPQNMTDTFYEMKIAGTQPIITHPERNHTIQRTPSRMIDWLREGCLVQITASSLTGRFGRTAQAMAFNFFEKKLGPLYRDRRAQPQLASAHHERGLQDHREKYGKETAERVCVTNPGAAFHGAEFPPQPEMLGLYDEPGTQPRKGLLGRLFSAK